MGRPVNTVARMLANYVDQTADCWVWKGSIAKNGYGKTAILKKTLLAHRVFYEYFKGPIAAGLQIDHLCRNKRCVNPAHLDAVPPAVNNARSTSPCALNAMKLFCKHGHALSGKNLYKTPDGRRQCVTCQGQRDKKNKEARFA